MKTAAATGSSLRTSGARADDLLVQGNREVPAVERVERNDVEHTNEDVDQRQQQEVALERTGDLRKPDGADRTYRVENLVIAAERRRHNTPEIGDQLPEPANALAEGQNQIAPGRDRGPEQPRMFALDLRRDAEESDHLGDGFSVLIFDDLAVLDDGTFLGDQCGGEFNRGPISNDRQGDRLAGSRLGVVDEIVPGRDLAAVERNDDVAILDSRRQCRRR